MIPIVSFVGRSNSGKTTFLEKVVAGLKSKGYRVAVVKHSHHDFDIDRPGKDSWRLAQAGSDTVVVSSPHKLAFIEHVDEEPSLSRIKALFEDRVDIVLAEGYKYVDTAKVLVLGPGLNQDEPSYRGEILAAITAGLSPLGDPQFDEHDVTSIINLLVEWIGESPPEMDSLGRLLAEPATLHSVPLAPGI